MVVCCRDRSSAGNEVRPANAETPQVVDIFRRYGDEYREVYTLTPEQDRVLYDMQRCRTAALGGISTSAQTAVSRNHNTTLGATATVPTVRRLLRHRWIACHEAAMAK